MFLSVLGSIVPGATHILDFRFQILDLKTIAAIEPITRPVSIDSAEPFGPESFDAELTTEGLTADGLVAGQNLNSKIQN